MPFDDLAGPFRIEQVGEALGRVIRFDEPGVVADDAEADAEACELAIRVLLVRWIVLRNVLRHEGRKQAVALPHDEMRGIGGVDYVDGMDVARIFLADALKHSFGTGALDPYRDARILCLEGLGDPLGYGEIDRGVIDDLAFLGGRVDERRRDRGRLRGGGAQWCRKHRHRGSARGLEHVAP
jgi:hypothetical protein